jgi:hypothetical protein
VVIQMPTQTSRPILWAVRDCDTGRRNVVQARSVAEAIRLGAALLGAPASEVEVSPTSESRNIAFGSRAA